MCCKQLVNWNLIFRLYIFSATKIINTERFFSSLSIEIWSHFLADCLVALQLTVLAVELAPAAANGQAKMRHAGAVVLTEVARAGRAHVLADVARVPTELGEVGEREAAVDDEALDGAVEAHQPAPLTTPRPVRVSVTG